MTEDPSSGPKLIAYSAHDCTIIAFINALIEDLPRHQPAHASSLFFELHHINGDQYIRIYYRNEGKTIPLKLKGIGYQCELSQFKKVFRQYIITVEEFYKKCSC